MTRSEERLKVGTETVTTGRVRLRKVVVTEQQQVSVPVSHEEVRVVREPISESDRGRVSGVRLRSARPSRRSPCTPNAPSSRPKWSQRNASASTPGPSPNNSR